MNETTKKTTKTVKKKAAATKKSAKKTVKKAKATAKKAKEAAVEATVEATENAENRFANIMDQIRDNLSEAREALSESGSVLDERRRDIAMQMIANMQENADETFASLEDLVNASSFGETLKISRDALRSGIERNVRQVKDIAEAASATTKDSVEPVAEYLNALGSKVRNRADA